MSSCNILFSISMVTYWHGNAFLVQVRLVKSQVNFQTKLSTARFGDISRKRPDPETRHAFIDPVGKPQEKSGSFPRLPTARRRTFYGPYTDCSRSFQPDRGWKLLSYKGKTAVECPSVKSAETFYSRWHLKRGNPPGKPKHTKWPPRVKGVTKPTINYIKTTTIHIKTLLKQLTLIEQLLGEDRITNWQLNNSTAR